MRSIEAIGGDRVYSKRRQSTSREAKKRIGKTATVATLSLVIMDERFAPKEPETAFTCARAIGYHLENLTSRKNRQKKNNHENRDKEKEQEFRNFCRRAGDAGEAEQCGDHSNHKKDGSPF
jgi:hypothetical protein